MPTQRTLCYIIDSDRVLLGCKRKGFGAGNVNGFGGKIEQGESAEQACCREVLEECGLVIKIGDLQKRAVVDFWFPEEKRAWDQQVHVYVCHQYEGLPQETEEMSPLWLPLKQLLCVDKRPIAGIKMWDADRYWLPLVLAGKNITGTVHYDANASVRVYEFRDGQGGALARGAFSDEGKRLE
jgi:8-oxo-dGTP diphosphatase